MTLEWTQIHPEARGCRTKDGKYSICSIGPRGTPDERWEAWKLAPGGPWFSNLAYGLQSEDEAKRIAQEDADKAVA